MAFRFSASKLIAVLAVLALAGCDTAGGGGGGGGGQVSQAGNSEAEADLARRAAGLQRTLAEGVAVGIAAATIGNQLFTNNRNSARFGIQFGAPAGLAAGSYVGFLQQRYASREARLEKIREDVEATNAETEAAIRTMRIVLAQQQRELSAIRASAAAGRDAQLTREVAEAQANLNNMNRAVAGAENRVQEFQSTRSLQLVEGELTGIDPQIAELSARIQSMRQIAQTLSNDI